MLDTIKEMLKEDKNILRALNMNYGFDFNKEIQAVKIDGSFTINKVLKETQSSILNDRIVVLVRTSLPYGWRKDHLMAVRITGMGAADFEIEHHKRWFDFPTIMDNYHAKGDFNEDRKNAAYCYVVVQSKELLSRVYEDPTPDLKGRLTVDEQKRLTSNRGMSYYSRQELVFDKSGYLLTNKRNDLAQRAKQLRAEREKESYKATDNMAIIQDFQDQLATLKTAIIEKLNMANTSDQIKTIADSLSWYKGLGDCFSKFEYIRNKETEKSFPSVDAFNSRVNDLNNAIAEVKNKIA